MTNKDTKKGRRMKPSAPSEKAANAGNVNEDKSAAGNSRLIAQKLYSALSQISNSFSKLKNPVRNSLILVPIVLGSVCIVAILTEYSGAIDVGCNVQGCYAKITGNGSKKGVEASEKPSQHQKIPKSDSAK